MFVLRLIAKVLFSSSTFVIKKVAYFPNEEKQSHCFHVALSATARIRCCATAYVLCPIEYIKTLL